MELLWTNTLSVTSPSKGKHSGRPNKIRKTHATDSALSVPAPQQHTATRQTQTEIDAEDSYFDDRKANARFHSGTPRATYASVASVGNSPAKTPEEPNADHVGESGPGPVPLRGLPSFPNQQPRNAPVNSPRLQNGKMGSAANWGFGLPSGGAAPGLPSLQTRAVSGGMGSFAQSLGGSQPATPLDPSEFPSLSGAPQTSQQQNAGQAVWGQSRPAQQQSNPSRQQSSSASQQTSQQPSQQQSQSSHDDLFPSAQQFANGLDDFRHGGQGISGQLTGTQPQTGSVEEFPPLGREVSSGLGGAGMSQGQERRGSLMQNSSGFGGYGGLGFPGLGQQQRNPLSNPMNQQDRVSSDGSGVLSNSRSPLQGQNGAIGSDKLNAIGSESQRTVRQEDYGDAQERMQQPQGQREQNAYAPNMMESPLGDPQDLPQLSQMSEIDKWGLAGLLGMIRHPSQDIANLTIGHDLTSLGLDLNQTEPLHPHFATPFAPSTPARPLETDYTLPQCYNVANVQPLSERIPSFSEETLFYIFYGCPRDILQELVADELMGRKWRYHKVEKMWVTRDETFPNPVEVEPRISERGVYIWWDYEGWKRFRREYVLRYEDLDDRTTRTNFSQPAGFVPPSMPRGL